MDIPNDFTRVLAAFSSCRFSPTAWSKDGQNLLEKVLSVFPPGKNGNRMIDVSEMDYPEEYREVIRRLLQAGAEKKIRDTMILEDEIIAELEGMERTIAEQGQALTEQGQALAENKRQLTKAVQILAKAQGITEEEAKKILSIGGTNREYQSTS